MKKIHLILIGFILIILAGFGIYYFTNSKNTNLQTNNLQLQSLPQANKAELIITLIDKPQTFDISHYVGQTALDATIKATSGRLVTKGEAENAYITSILDVSADDSKNQFWELIVNGSPSQVGAGSYIIAENDKIEWKLKTY